MIIAFNVLLLTMGLLAVIGLIGGLNEGLG